LHLRVDARTGHLNLGEHMSHVTSHETSVVPAQADGAGANEDLAVRSALKAMLERELAQEASASEASPAPLHMAGPGRLTPAG
jgi:phosphosulfolactate phosphohydrolase-like enzyme